MRDIHGESYRHCSSTKYRKAWEFEACRAERFKLWLSAFDLPIEGYRYPAVVSTLILERTERMH